MKPEKQSIIQAQCPICSEEDIHTIDSYKGDSDLFRNLHLMRCSNCGLTFAHPMPSQRELDHYNTSYFENAHGGLEQGDEAVLFSSGIAKLRLRHIEMYANKKQANIESVLEIGPGHGFFCRHLLARYPKANYVTIETDSSCREYLDQLGIRTFDGFGSMPSGCNSYFDLAVASHVLEHTSEPIVFVQQMAGLLKPGGVMFIEVPCRDYEFKEMNEPHLLFFDMPSLNRLLSEAGLVEAEVTYHGKDLKKLRSERSYYARWRKRLARAWKRFDKQKNPLNAEDTLSVIEDSAERNVVEPYEAHLLKAEPSWWLRALARRPYQ